MEGIFWHYLNEAYLQFLFHMPNEIQHDLQLTHIITGRHIIFAEEMTILLLNGAVYKCRNDHQNRNNYLLYSIYKCRYKCVLCINQPFDCKNRYFHSKLYLTIVKAGANESYDNKWNSCWVMNCKISNCNYNIM